MDNAMIAIKINFACICSTVIFKFIKNLCNYILKINFILYRMSSKKLSPLSQIKYSKDVISKSMVNINNISLNDVIKKEIIVIEKILNDSESKLICQRNLIKYYPAASKKTSTKKIRKLCNRLDKAQRNKLKKEVIELKKIVNETNEKSKIYRLVKFFYNNVANMRFIKKKENIDLLSYNELIIEFSINLINLIYFYGFASYFNYLLSYFAYKTIYEPIMKPKNTKERLSGITNFINIIIGAQLMGIENEKINLILNNLGIPTHEITKSLSEIELKKISGNFMFPIIKFRDFLKTDFTKSYGNVSLTIIANISNFVVSKAGEGVASMISMFK